MEMKMKSLVSHKKTAGKKIWTETEKLLATTEVPRFLMRLIRELRRNLTSKKKRLFSPTATPKHKKTRNEDNLEVDVLHLEGFDNKLVHQMDQFNLFTEEDPQQPHLRRKGMPDKAAALQQPM